MKTRIVLIVVLAVMTVSLNVAVSAQNLDTPHDAHISSEGLAASVSAELQLELVKLVGGSTWDIVVNGNLAYMGIGPRLAVVNISQPESPVLVGNIGPLPGVVENIEVLGNYVFLAAGDGGMYVIDAASPSQLVILGRFQTPGEAQSIAVTGNIAYLAVGPVWQGLVMQPTFCKSQDPGYQVIAAGHSPLRRR